MDHPRTLIALLSGPDQPGLVARVAGWIFDRRGNILHADQHRDMEEGIFFNSASEWGASVQRLPRSRCALRSSVSTERRRAPQP